MKFLVRNFQHLHHLCPGADGIGREFPAASAVGDLLLIRPLDGLGVPAVCGHIRKDVFAAFRGRRTGDPPQESGHLGSGAGGIWGEFPVAGSAGDALFRSPQHRVVVVGIGTYIGEGIGRANLGGAAGPATRHKKVAIWARVQGALGENFPPPVPPVTPSSTAHSTAS